MRVDPLPAVGALITDVSISELSTGQFEALVPLLQTHGVLVFRKTEGVTPEDLLRFVLMHPDADHAAARYNPFAKGDPSCLPGLPMVRALGTRNGRDGKPHPSACGATPEENRVGREWHTDGQGVTVLMCCEAPGIHAGDRTAENMPRAASLVLTRLTFELL